MYLLDTNVVSDLRRPKRLTAAAIDWFKAADPSTLHISALSVFEIRHGIVELSYRD